jgi:hypothetical protein
VIFPMISHQSEPQLACISQEETALTTTADIPTFVFLLLLLSVEISVSTGIAEEAQTARNAT